MKKVLGKIIDHKFLFLMLFVFLWVIPGIAFAAGDDLPTFLQKFYNNIAIITAAAGVLTFVLGGFTYMTSSGNKDKVKRARTYIEAGVIAIAVVASASIFFGFLKTEIPGGGAQPVTDPNAFMKDLITTIETITKILLGVSGVVAVIFIAKGGAEYIFSAGDKTKALAAIKTIQNAIVGLLGVVLATTLFSFAMDFIEYQKLTKQFKVNEIIKVEK